MTSSVGVGFFFICFSSIFCISCKYFAFFLLPSLFFSYIFCIYYNFSSFYFVYLKFLDFCLSFVLIFVFNFILFRLSSYNSEIFRFFKQHDNVGKLCSRCLPFGHSLSSYVTVKMFPSIVLVLLFSCMYSIHGEICGSCFCEDKEAVCYLNTCNSQIVKSPEVEIIRIYGQLCDNHVQQLNDIFYHNTLVELLETKCTSNIRNCR